MTGTPAIPAVMRGFLEGSQNETVWLASNIAGFIKPSHPVLLEDDNSKNDSKAAVMYWDEAGSRVRSSI